MPSVANASQPAFEDTPPGGLWADIRGHLGPPAANAGPSFRAFPAVRAVPVGWRR